MKAYYREYLRARSKGNKRESPRICITQTCKVIGLQTCVELKRTAGKGTMERQDQTTSIVSRLNELMMMMMMLYYNLQSSHWHHFTVNMTRTSLQNKPIKCDMHTHNQILTSAHLKQQPVHVCINNGVTGIELLNSSEQWIKNVIVHTLKHSLWNVN